MAGTVAELIRDATERLRASGSATARLDAEVLLAHVLGVDRTAVVAHGPAAVGEGQAATFADTVRRRAAGEPVAYIRGIKEFHGLAFAVDPRALIPRPESELLVDLALQRVRRVLTGAPRPAGTPPFLVWDVGTGSGAVVVSLAVGLRRLGYRDEVRFVASDTSRDALELAVENAVAHGVADAIGFRGGDLLEAEPPEWRTELIVANLPYIPSAVVLTLPAAARFEPREALDGGPDGLSVIRRLIAQLPRCVAPGGLALIEFGADQAEPIRSEAARVLPGWGFTVQADLSGHPRVAELERTSGGSP